MKSEGTGPFSGEGVGSKKSGFAAEVSSGTGGSRGESAGTMGGKSAGPASGKRGELTVAATAGDSLSPTRERRGFARGAGLVEAVAAAGVLLASAFAGVDDAGEPASVRRRGFRRNGGVVSSLMELRMEMFRQARHLKEALAVVLHDLYTLFFV